MRQLFPDSDRTYKTYKNAKKVIDKLKDGNYAWAILANEDGRFKPTIFARYDDLRDMNVTHFYFIEKGCCIQII